jgi:hypothetical protein
VIRRPLIPPNERERTLWPCAECGTTWCVYRGSQPGHWHTEAGRPTGVPSLPSQAPEGSRTSIQEAPLTAALPAV